MTKSTKNNDSAMSNENPNDDNEPKENDKFTIEENNGDPEKLSNQQNNQPAQQKKSMRSRFEELNNRLKRAKDELSTNRHRRIELLLLLLIFVLFIVVLILTIKLLTIEHPRQVNLCETSECLITAGSVVGALNQTHDPCQDFWLYSCHNWINKNQDNLKDGSWSVRDQVIRKTNLELKHYIDLIPSNLPDSNLPDAKVRAFYYTCININDADITSHKLNHEIKDLGGWKITNSWSPSTWNYNSVIEKLYTRYGVNAYFKVSIGPDDLDPNQPYIIKIEPSGLGLPSKSYYYDTKYEKQADAYQNFMKEVIKMFEQTAFEANYYSKNVFNYEKRLAEITPDFEKYLKPSEYIRKRYSIRELTTIAPAINWLNFFHKVYPYASINEGTRVIIAFEDYLRDVSRIISTTDSVSINDYLMWRFLSTYAPYLNEQFRTIYYEFSQTMNGLDRQSVKVEDRWEFCIKATSKFLGPALSALYVRNKVQHRVSESYKAQEIVSHIKQTMLKRIDLFSWVKNNQAKNLVKQKIENLEALIGFPKYIANEKDLKLYYNDLITYGTGFYENILYAVTFMHRKSESMLRLRPPQLSDQTWPVLAHDVDIRYQYAGNKLIIPSGFLQYPYFDANLPSSLKFGSFGFHVVSEALRALDLVGIQYGLPDFRLTQQYQLWYPDKEQQSLHEKLQCLYQELKEYSLLSDFINPNLTYSKTYTDIGALMFAYDAYKSWVASVGEQGQLPGTHRNNDQLFFIGFAQSMCEVVEPKKSVILSDYQTELPSKIRVKTILKQFNQFSNVFGCKKSPVCHLWN